MLKAMFEQFVSEYEIYPFTSRAVKETDRIKYYCKSNVISLCFVIEIDTNFPYRWQDIIELVGKRILHIVSIKVY